MPLSRSGFDNVCSKKLLKMFVAVIVCFLIYANNCATFCKYRNDAFTFYFKPGKNTSILYATNK